MLELGAGAGRNTPRYAGFERIVVLDYSTTQLAQAQQRLGATLTNIFTWRRISTASPSVTGCLTPPR